MPTLNQRVHRNGFLVLTLLTSIVSQAADEPSTKQPAVQLTSAQSRFVRQIERELVTRLNSKKNPGDQNTWYVLALIDHAAVRRIGSSRTSSKVTIAAEFRASTKPQSAVVQGKRNAALTVARFYMAINTATPFVSRSSLPTRSNATQFRVNKVWRYVAFETEKDAQAFLRNIMPRSAR